MSANDIKKRKESHLDIVLSREVEAKKETTWLEYVYLVHRALPEIDLGDVDTTTTFLGKRLNAPILIDCMTGGLEKGAEINMSLARISKRLGVGMGVGSQRAALENPDLRRTFEVVREEAPEIFVMANIGGAQLSKGLRPDDVIKCIEMVRADAIAIHLNPLQEAVQAEGEPYYKGVLRKIEEIVGSVGVPVIVKEVGCGLSREVVALLDSVGVSAFNVAGVGGTSWPGVESLRSTELNKLDKGEIGKLFWDWGIPTAAAILEARSVTDKPIIASGGIRTGLDIAKSIALGADLAALALPVIRKLLKEGEEAAYSYLSRVVEELKLAMFLTGSRRIDELKKTRVVLVGKLADWGKSLEAI